MTPRQLKRLFPNASQSTLKANGGDYDAIPDHPIASGGEIQEFSEYKSVPMVSIYSSPMPKLTLTITGQIRGGKNNMIVTKNGKHVPRPEWKKWRDAAVAEVQSQLPQNWEPISVPTNIVIEYVAGNRRRRDFPAICDAIFHVLERAGVIEDDTLLWPSRSHRDYNKHQPMTRITFL